MGEVLNKDFLPIFPSLTAPGVSPRGRNQPSFNVLYQSPEDSTGNGAAGESTLEIRWRQKYIYTYINIYVDTDADAYIPVCAK
jgi:hypothetical protein